MWSFMERMLDKIFLPFDLVYSVFMLYYLLGWSTLAGVFMYLVLNMVTFVIDLLLEKFLRSRKKKQKHYGWSQSARGKLMEILY